MEHAIALREDAHSCGTKFMAESVVDVIGICGKQILMKGHVEGSSI